jgi:LEA14-like dessication related protein
VIPYDAEMGLSVDVSGSGPMRLPLRKSGELPIPNLPTVEVSSFHWDTLSLSEVTGNLALDVGNTNEFPFSLRTLDYELSLAGSKVADGLNSEGLELAAGGGGTLTIPLSFSPASAGFALVNMLRGAEADYSILGNLAIETPFGPMELPFDRSGAAASSQ